MTTTMDLEWVNLKDVVRFPRDGSRSRDSGYDYEVPEDYEDHDEDNDDEDDWREHSILSNIYRLARTFCERASNLECSNRNREAQRNGSLSKQICLYCIMRESRRTGA